MPAILSETAHHQKCNVSESGLIVACFSHFDFDSVSRHSGVHFFDASTSKSDPKPSVFNTFDFETRFTPQWRALFEHLNVQKWYKCSKHGALCKFWFQNAVLTRFPAQRRAMSEHVNLNFQKCSKGGVLCPSLSSLTSKCASRHNSRHFFEYLRFQKCSATDTKFNIIYTSRRASRHSGVHFSTSCHIVPDWGTFHFLISKICFAQHFSSATKRSVSEFFHFFKRLHLLILASTWFSFFFLSIFPFLLTLPTSPVSVFHIVGRLPSQPIITASRSWPGQHHSISIIIVGYCGQT